MRRRELFPADRGLQVRMVLTAVLTPLVVVAALASTVEILSTKRLIVLGGVVLAGVFVIVRARREVEAAAPLAPDERPDLQRMIERLCLLADLPTPDIVVDDEPQPNSWIVDAPGRRARLHLTTGLLALLDDAELEAVVAHELAHVGHRDAMVMSMVALPSAVLIEGSRFKYAQRYPFWVAGLLAKAIGHLGRVGTSALSRYRELTADAGAARLTGNPSALASALMKVSGQLARFPAEDLRAAAARNAFNLMPAEAERWAFFRTHPSLERRLAALERLEHHLQHARLPSDPHG